MTEQEFEKLATRMVCAMLREDDFVRMARAALAVAEPVIREQCAEDAAAIAKEHLTDAVARLVAAAIREGGNT